MLKDSSFLEMLLWNFVIIGIWHLLCYIACIRLPESTFDASKNCYTAKPWEHGGQWYRDNLKINLWKDKLPQHIGKNDFSKRHLTSDSIDYLDHFIMETCRGEWVHMRNALCAIITLLVNPFLVGIITALFITIANIPFAVVQRYNRFRLQALRRRRQRSIRSHGMERKAVTA